MPQTIAPNPPSRLAWVRPAAWLTAAGLLLAPLVAMRFTSEVVWTAGDFACAALLLFGPLIAFEVLTRRTASLGHRIAIAATLGGAALLTWVNGAVGIIGDEANPANRIFVAIALAGVAAAVVLAMRAPRR
ncbi:MAG: hypothetical protein PGN08_01075 [Sphingomonas taxi]